MVETRVIAGLAIALVMLGGLAFTFGGSTATGQVTAAELESFAQCLSDRNATFYGASWCPHCNEQKAMFGDAMEHIDYVECHPDGGRQSPPAEICQQRGITGYPTWIIDGERHSGVLSFQELADATGCSLP